MNIERKQLDGKPIKIGELAGKPIYQLRTLGGLYILVLQKGGSFETIGVGPHQGIARHIASKREPDIQWTYLSKSEHVSIEAYTLILPIYEGITNDFRHLQGLV